MNNAESIPDPPIQTGSSIERETIVLDRSIEPLAA